MLLPNWNWNNYIEYCAEYQKPNQTINNNKPSLSLSFYSARYPPYSDGKLSYLTMLLKKRPGISYKYFTYAFLIGIGAASAMLYNTFTKVK